MAKLNIAKLREDITTIVDGIFADEYLNSGSPYNDAMVERRVGEIMQAVSNRHTNKTGHFNDLALVYG